MATVADLSADQFFESFQLFLANINHFELIRQESVFHVVKQLPLELLQRRNDAVFEFVDPRVVLIAVNKTFLVLDAQTGP